MYFEDNWIHHVILESDILHYSHTEEYRVVEPDSVWRRKRLPDLRYNCCWGARWCPLWCLHAATNFTVPGFSFIYEVADAAEDAWAQQSFEPHMDRKADTKIKIPVCLEELAAW